MDPAGGCQQLAKFADIASVEALDDMTVKITFNKAKPFPYGPMVGSQTPVIQQAQFKDCVGIKAPECTAQNFGPIGTGPFVVTDFKANDVIALVANPNYRDAAKPAFASVTLKGGGDAAAAARSVLETGEFDYGWNLQVDPAILKQMASAGKGQVVSAFGTSVERFMINATNPDPALGDKRGTVEGGPHPYLSDPAVRKALSMAIDRQVISDAGYGAAGKPTCNVLPAPAIYASTANDSCLVQDIAGANKMLDDAGWARASDGIRAKNGVRISILYQTSTNAVRQDTQALVKQWWNEIGVEVELKNISASVFFGGDQSSPDTFQKFFSDVEMYTNNFDGTDPEAYMGGWVCSEAPTPANNWLGANMPRYCNPAYDALSAEMSGTGDLNERARLAKTMNDMLIQDGAIIALVHRGNVSAHANSLAGVKLNTWDSELWNIADWSRN